MSETFQSLAPLLRPLLEAPPGAKRPRGQRQQMAEHPSAPGQQLLHLMSRILLNHERDLHNLRSQDSYILFVNHEEGGSLQLLIHEAAQWRKLMESQQTAQTLRSYLLLKLLEELKKRLLQVIHPTEGLQLRTTLEAKNMLFKDQSWPFQCWNPKTSQMETDPRKQAMPMGSLTKLLDELLDQATVGHAVERFQALAPLTEDFRKSHVVTPWRLQVSLRCHDFYHQIGRLSYNTCWSLVGVQMKPHTQTMGGPAKQLQTQLGLAKKGSGKGKNKQPSQHSK